MEGKIQSERLFVKTPRTAYLDPSSLVCHSFLKLLTVNEKQVDHDERMIIEIRRTEQEAGTVLSQH
jgi:hypothetical protein